MISMLLSDRRALRLSAVAVASAALLSACDTDRSTGPVQRAMPDSASLALSPNSLTGSLAISVVDWAKNPVKFTGSFFLVSKPGMNDTELRDNTAPDVNFAIGGLLMKNLVAGTYTVCQQSPAEHYVMVYAPCKTVTVFAGKVAQLEFINLQTARFGWWVVDTWNNPIETMLFKGTDVNGQSRDITDNGAWDLDERQGYIEVDGPVGNYEVCQVALPNGYVFPTGQTYACTTRYITNGAIASMPQTRLNHEYSIHWRLRLDDQVYWPASAGQVAFEIKGLTGSGPFSMTVYDNGANDLDAEDDLRMGEFAAKLPAAGTYTVCQLNPANGFQFPSKPCMRVSVGLGVPQLVGWFFNLKI